MVLNFSNWNMLGMNGYGAMGGFGSACNGYSSGCGNSIFGSILGGFNMLGSGYNMISGMLGGGYGSMGSMLGGYGSMLGGGLSSIGSYLMGGLSSLFTNCNGTLNYDVMAGVGAGLTALKLTGAVVQQVFANRQENSYKTLNANVKDINAQIKTEAKRLGYTTAEEVLALSGPEAKYTEAHDNASKAVAKAQNDIESYTAQYNEHEKSITAKNTEIAGLEAQLHRTTDENTKANLRSEIQDYKNEIERLRGEQDNIQKKKAAEEAKIATDGVLQKELDATANALKERKALIKEVQANIKKLQKQLETSKDLLEDRVLDKANGNPFTRTSDKKFDAMFNDDNTLKNGESVDKRDLKAAIYSYQNADTVQEQEKAKARLKALWQNASPEDKDSKFLKSAYNAIMLD